MIMPAAVTPAKPHPHVERWLDVTERKLKKSQDSPIVESIQDPGAYKLPASRRSGPITYRLEIVAVPGQEGEALLKSQQAAILNALRWAAANNSESENTVSGIVEQPEHSDDALDEIIVVMDPRPLTQREQSVLEALLAVDFEGAENLRHQVANIVVVGMCSCGCPTIDFQPDTGLGMSVRVNASVSTSNDGLFLYTIEDPEHGELLGGVEWVGVGDTNPDEFPEPELLDIQPA